MSDTQDDRFICEISGLLIPELPYDIAHGKAERVYELCRAHFQQKAEPVGCVDVRQLLKMQEDDTYAELMPADFRVNDDQILLYTSLPIPPDMVMVPREPTEERLKRGVRAFQSGFNGTDNLSDWLAFWQAMITDAPANKEGT